MPQEPPLFPVSVRENIAYGMPACHCMCTNSLRSIRSSPVVVVSSGWWVVSGEW